MHFFCELTNLPALESQSFGPIAVTPGPDYSKKFGISSCFDLSSNTNAVKAFACQAGMMIVQQSSNPALVNLIIKPDKSSDIKFPPAVYYIYRGISAASFLDTANGNVIIPKTATGKTEAMTRFWANWDSYLTATNQQDTNPLGTDYAAPPTRKSLGYEPTLSDSLNVESIYNNSQTDVRAFRVNEGEWIGDFANVARVCFEIITDREGILNEVVSSQLVTKGVCIEYLKKEYYETDVTPFPDSTDEEKYRLKVKREEILNYIDPAAYFGMHYYIGVDTTTYTGVTKNPAVKKKEQQIYTDILVRYAHKHRVYIDIRSEKGYSYNFYENYPDVNSKLLKVKASTVATFNEDPYYTFGWPIFYDENWVGTTDKNRVDIQLRVVDNLKPLLFFITETEELKTGRFIEDLTNSGDFEWTKTVQLVFPNVTATKNNIAWHIKLQYLRREYNSASPVTVPKFESFLDNVFGSVDLPFANDAGSIALFQKLSSSKLTSVIGSDYAYVTYPSVFETNDLVAYYTEKSFAHKESSQDYPKIPGVVATNSPDLTSASVFPKEAVFIRIPLTISGSTVPVIDLASFNKDKKATKKEDVFLLCLTKPELEDIEDLADTEGLSKAHLRTLVFSSKTSATSTNGIPYTKYELKVQGIKSSTGKPHITAGSGKFVYTLGERIFCTQAAGASTTIPTGLPDAGTLTQWNYTGRWDYDRDDATVQSVFPAGEVSVKFSGPTSKTTEIRGVCFFPSDSPAGTLSTVKPQYPVVAIIHGNGHVYNQYEGLCRHLAQNGFIALSVSCLTLGALEYLLKTVASAASFFTVVNPLFDYYFQPASGDPYFYDSTNNKIYSPLLVSVSPVIYDGTEVKLTTAITFVSGSPNKIKFAKAIGVLQGMEGIGRAELLYANLRVLREKFSAGMTTVLENNVGIMGHSRGGESVVKAANDILGGGTVTTDLAGVNNLKAVVSLAPTDNEVMWGGAARQTLSQNVPYLVIYGSRDYDVAGRFGMYNPSTVGDPRYASDENFTFLRTGFSLYDRASLSVKSMLYVKGATHNGFITSNSPDIRSSAITGSGLSVFAADAVQRGVSYAYMNAFFRMNLLNEAFWLPYFTGETKPASVGSAEITTQYERPDQRVVIDDMESQPDWFKSSSVQDVKLNDATTQTPDVIKQGSLRSMDTANATTAVDYGVSPYYKNGIRLFWSDNDRLVFKTGTMNVTAYAYLSLSIANGSVKQKISGLQIGLKDASNTEKLIAYSVDIPSPDKREDLANTNPGSTHILENPTKAAMQTIRMPLLQYQAQGINLSTVTDIILVLPALGSGITGSRKINVDSVMFTN